MFGDFGIEVFLAGALGATFAGVSKGGFGSGAAFAGVAILAVFVPPGVALGLMLPLLLVIDAASMRPYWQQWSWSEARLLIAGGVPGVIAGAFLFRVAQPDHFRLLIGVIALGFVIWQFCGRFRQRPAVPASKHASRSAGLIAGVLAGFTSFVSHAGGPIVAVYLLARGLDKTRYQATTVVLFAALNVIKLGIYGVLGIFTVQILKFALLLSPFALMGTWLGVRAHRIVPERLFFGLTYVLLGLTGAKLIWDGMT